MSALGRRVPTDWAHYDKYPLSAAVPSKPVPVAIGVNWYLNFDSPVKDNAGRYWIGRGNLGGVRGGHCVALEPGGLANQDTAGNWSFYDQGNEGACVGFGCSRMMSLLNRRRYFARWLWDQAKATDEWDDTNPGDDNGTSVRAALAILKKHGHVPWKTSYEALNDQPQDYKARDKLSPIQFDGILAYRWAKNTDEVLAALKSPASERMGAVRILNSWGRGYPHKVWMPLETLQRLIDEDGEVGIPTDR